MLSDAFPKEADDLLRDVFGRRFQGLAANYVLSHLTVTPKEVAVKLTDKVADQAAADFAMHINDVEQEVLEWAKRRLGKEFPQPAYIETAKEAVTCRRESTTKNSFAPIDIQPAARRLAEDMGRKWWHAVTPKQ
ncbi:MAG TPA: hypothetical protein VMT96_00605 [Candidatus Bathyarchaeia archaeon]|nr:hypothetical protein [Candidatus Bathyarchaeia archaeon]